MSEKDLQDAVRKTAELFRWRYYHTHRSQHSVAGYPDCTLVRRGRLVYAELKRDGEYPTEAQVAWLDDLGGVPGVEVHVWRPEDWHSGHIEGVLR